jgi:hypothetical protein
MELFRLSAARAVAFYVVFMILVYVLNYYSSSFLWLSSLITLIVSILTFFVPQSIVIDNTPILTAIGESFLFIKKNYIKVIQILLTILILGIVLLFLEFALDQVFFLGRYISFILSTVIIVPIFELMKTRVYLKKISLLNHYMAHNF